jgi:energy-coupling factor transporter ATP-binding protein EcfA2
MNMFFDATLRNTVRQLARKEPIVDKSDEAYQRPRDVTTDMLTWMRRGATDVEFSFMALINGTGGSGKTTLAMMFATVLMNSDKSRVLALWNTPDSLEVAIKKQVKVYLPQGEGDTWADRVITIKKVSDVKKNYIVIVDEGVLNINAKRALNDDMVEFEKMISIARHLRVVVICNSIFQGGVTKSFRSSAQLKVYKLMPSDNIKEFKSDFVKANAELLTKLKKPEALIECSHPKFMKSGYIFMDLLDYCPWYNMEISQSMGATGSADFGKDKRLVIEDRIRTVADMAMASLGEKFGFDKSKKWCTQQIIRAWMREAKLDDLEDMEKVVGKIVDTIQYKLLFFNQTNDLGTATSVLAPTNKPRHDQSPDTPTTIRQDANTPGIAKLKKNTGDLLSDGFDYGQFFYDCAKSQQYDEKTRLLSKLTMQGFTLVQLCEHPKIGMSETWVTNLRSVLLRDWFGYWAEWAWARVLDVEPPTDIYGDRPDLIIQVDRDYMGLHFPAGSIFSVKFKIDKTATQPFTQWTEGDDRGDLNPEYTEAVARGSIYYLIILNPRWSVTHFYVKKVDPHGLRMIEARKPRGRNADAVLLP